MVRELKNPVHKSACAIAAAASLALSVPVVAAADPSDSPAPGPELYCQSGQICFTDEQGGEHRYSPTLHTCENFGFTAEEAANYDNQTWTAFTGPDCTGQATVIPAGSGHQGGIPSSESWR